jgi:hypothetical protein
LRCLWHKKEKKKKKEKKRKKRIGERIPLCVQAHWH